jgi:hypothetical protein
MTTEVEPVAEHPLLDAVTVLVPEVDQVIWIELEVELPVPPPVFQVQAPATGVQLFAVALKVRAWLI